MKKIPVFLLFFMPFIGQTQTTDKGVWTGISFEKKITKKFSVALNGQHRLMNNFSVTKSWIGEAGLSYKLFKGLEVSGMYRFIRFNDYKPKKQIYVYESRHRYYGDISYQFSIKSIKISNRLRYQNQFKDNGVELVQDKNYLRHKIEAEYESKSRISPYVSSDFFYQLGGVGLDQVRIKTGISVKTFKGQSIDVAPFMNIPINDPTTAKEFVLQLNYKFRL
jgi:Protein of unknown function (DUF2490)